MDEGFKIDRGSDRCSRCGGEPPPWAPGFSGLYARTAGEEGYERRDFCEACFKALGEEERPLSFWRRAQRAKAAAEGKETPGQKRKRDLEVLAEMFERLGEDGAEGAGAGTGEGVGVGEGGRGDSEDAARKKLRYVLALALVRHRRLELVDLAREGGADVLILRASGRADVMTVPAPTIARADFERLARELEAEVGGRKPSAPGVP